MSSILTFGNTNPLYDGGATPYTEAGRQAYAKYIVSVLDKYGSSVHAIEVWNEFNGANFVTGPATKNLATYYTALLKTVYEAVKATHPDVMVLGGAAHSVATGYLTDLFKLGALNYMDGIALHPYRTSPEHVDDELNHLNDVMAQFGAVKPIFATEFGKEFNDPAEAPSYLMKMVTQMSAAHVAESSWYALQDQTWFKNMGLFDNTGAAKPAAKAFAFAENTLLPKGDAVQVATDNPHTLIYKFGTDTYVMWGDTRAISFSGAATFYNAKGEEISAPTQLGSDPIIVRGAGSYTLGDSAVVADSLYDYNEGAFKEGGWSYLAKTADGAIHPLHLVDSQYTSYMGSGYYNPLRINDDSLVPAGNGASPIDAVSRFTSATAQAVEIKGTWSAPATSDGVDVHVVLNGQEIFTKIVTGTFNLSGLYVDLKPGDTLDFLVGPNKTITDDQISYRVQLVKTTATDLSFAGAPRLVGGDGDDVLQGGAADETLKGFGGHNTLDGGAGVDTVSYDWSTVGVKVDLSKAAAQAVSGATTDTLLNIENVTGSASHDTLTGSTGANLLDGGAGNDIIVGGAGADTLIGGAGADTLTGGAGADRFVIKLSTDTTSAVRDLITDFSHADGDVIDLSAIDANTRVAGDQAFTLVSTYTKHAGELTFTWDAPGAWTLKGDTNGDGASDFMVTLLAPTKPVLSDFIL